MSEPRRFDSLERVVRDLRRKLADVESTVLARLATHTHGARGVVDQGSLSVWTRIDASEGNHFRVTANGDVELRKPDNPTDGQIITFEYTANGGDRTPQLPADAWKFGTTITGVTAVAAGTTDIIRAVYNADADRWWVFDYKKGF